MNLNDAMVGENLIVTGLTQKGDTEITKLTAMGILPGVRLQIIQKRPLPVFKIGFSRFAIDEKLATLIQVEKAEEAATDLQNNQTSLRHKQRAEFHTCSIGKIRRLLWRFFGSDK